MAYTLHDAQKIIPTISKDTIKCIDQEAAFLGVLVFFAFLPIALVFGLFALIPALRSSCVDAIYDLADMKVRICRRYLINRICDKS